MTTSVDGTRAPRSFRDLSVWQEATTLARAALAAADAMPSGYGFLADQLRRAAASIPLNIAEGNGKPTRREYQRYLSIARGSLNEVEAIVELARGTPIAPPSAVDEMTSRIPRVGRLLSALHASLHTPRRQ